MDLLLQTSVRSVSSTSPVGLSVSRNVEVGARVQLQPQSLLLASGWSLLFFPAFTIHPESLHSQLFAAADPGGSPQAHSHFLRDLW